MKFSAPLALACFSAGVLSNVTPRDPSDFLKVIDSVENCVDSLKIVVDAYSGDASPVQAAVTTLVDDMMSGNTKLSAQATLNLAETFELNEKVTSFINHVKDLIKSLQLKLVVIRADGKCGLVRENIYAIDTAAVTLMKTIVVHCNPVAQKIAEEREALLQGLLNGCKEDFNTSNCP
ncbi:hypothetical protein G3M48_001223 [Beauveria asiatica]|uniref:Cell wall protein n=1 Tax=Beauveria asiatica TaxID=1069075 RepID=A0AAW0S068_9HYPO